MPETHSLSITPAASLAELAQGLATHKFSSLELIQERLNLAAQLNPSLNAFISLTADQALAAAKIADAQRAAGTATGVTGIPIAYQDLFCTQGITTSAASKMLANFVAPYNATVVQRLNQAGAVSLGKTNLAEMGLGATTATSFFGGVQLPAEHPTAGALAPGAAAGSAVAVLSGLIAASVDVDSGGSVRTTAAQTGLVSLKPTFGRVSRWGMLAAASSMDQASIMAQQVADLAQMLEHLAGVDKRDALSAPQAVPAYSEQLLAGVQGLTVGLPQEIFAQLSAPETAAIEASIQTLEKLGLKVREVSLPYTAITASVYALLSAAEASSNLSRYDGVRYGYRCADPVDLEDLYRRSRSEALGAEVKAQILAGTYVLSESCYASHYHQAQLARRLIVTSHLEALQKVDFLLTPVVGHTQGASLAGLPALTLPVDKVAAQPVAVQLLAAHWEESKLLAVGHQFQLARHN